MIRKCVFGGLALLIAIITFANVSQLNASAGLNNEGGISFNVHGDPGTNTEYWVVECYDIKSDLEHWGYTDPERRSDSMSGHDIWEYADVALQFTEEVAPEDWAEFRATVNEETGRYCDQLRREEQTDIIVAYGTALLWLSLVGMAAILTAPRPKTVAVPAEGGDQSSK